MKKAALAHGAPPEVGRTIAPSSPPFISRHFTGKVWE